MHEGREEHNCPKHFYRVHSGVDRLFYDRRARPDPSGRGPNLDLGLPLKHQLPNREAERDHRVLPTPLVHLLDAAKIPQGLRPSPQLHDNGHARGAGC